MIKLLEAAGERLLARFVPKATAEAAGCTCSWFGYKTTCYQQTCCLAYCNGCEYALIRCYTL